MLWRVDNNFVPVILQVYVGRESQVNMPNSATTLYNPYISGYIYAHLATNYGCESTDGVYVYVQQFPVIKILFIAFVLQNTYRT